MTTDYVHSLTVIAPADEAAAVRGLFATFDCAPGEGEQALGLALTANGVSVTHYEACEPITEAKRLMLRGAMLAGALPTGTKYLLVPNDPAGNVIGTNVVGYDPTADDGPPQLRAALGLTVFDEGAD